MKELIIKKGDKQITLADKEDVMDALEDKSDKNHDHDLKDLNIYADGQGGTNLIEDTQIFNTPLTNVGLRDGTYKNCTYRRVDNTSGTNYLDIGFKIPAGTFKHGEKYTLSFWAKGTGNIVVFNVGGTNCIKTKPINWTSGGTNIHFSQYTDGKVSFALTSEWKRYFVTWELNPTSDSTNDISVNKILILRTIAGADAYWAGVMYERGEIPHDWSPSPKDIPRENITASSTSIADLNHYRKAGFYYNNNANEAKYIIHCPNSDGTDTPYTNNHSFFLLVEDWGSVAYSVKQTLTYYDDDTIYIRRYVNGNWGTWKKTLNSSNYSTYANKTTIVNNLTTTTAGSALDATQGKALNDSIDNLSEQVDDIVAGDVNLTNYAKKDDSRIVDAQERYDGYRITGVGTVNKPYLRIFNLKSSGDNTSSSHLIFEMIGLNSDKLYGKFRIDLRSNLTGPTDNQVPTSSMQITPLEYSNTSKWINKFYFAKYQNGLNVNCDIFFKTVAYEDVIFRIYDGHTRNGTITQLEPVINGNESYTTIESAGTTLYNSNYNEIEQKEFILKADKFVKANGQSTEFLKADGSVDTNTYAKSSDLTSAKITDTNTYSNINNTTQTQKGINEAINNRLAALNDLDLVKVVGSKPTPSANTMNKLYLTTESPSVEEDEYEIFITVRSGSSGNYTYAWEKVDTARVNLSDYIQTNDPRLTDKRKPAATLIDASSTNPVDLNTIREIGFYYTLSSDGAKYVSNCPNSSTGSAPFTNNKMFYLLVETLGSGSDRSNVKQTLTYYDDDTIYIRRYVNGNWGTWKKTLNSSNYSTYASPNNHNHDGTYIKTGTGTVTSTNIADKTIVNGDIADATITGGKLVDGTITNAKIGNNQVNNAKLSDNAVTTAKITDANVTTAKIADSAVTSAKIADKTIVNADIADNAAIAYSKLSGVASSTHNHNSDYVKLSGSQTMTGNILIPSNADSSDNNATGNIPYAGTIIDASSVQNFCETHKSFIGVINDGTWRHLISSRHRNGAGDGNNYGFYISSDNDVNGHLKFNKEWHNVWGTERTILDSSNYSNYANKTTVSDNLTDTSTTNALSSNQGKVLKGLVDGKSPNDHNHDSTYIKKTGGVSQHSNGNIIIPSASDTSANDATGKIPFAGHLTSSQYSIEDFTTKLKSVMGGIKDKDNKWWNVISARQTNGGGSDGENQGLLLKTRLESTGDLIWNKQYNGNWGTERTILDSSNYSTYANKTTIANNLTTTTAGSALDATQGKWLYNNTAPTSHATTTTTYGGGTASNYGHVKLSDAYTSSGGAASASVGASSKAVADAYSTLNTNKADKSNYVTVVVKDANGDNTTYNFITK